MDGEKFVGRSRKIEYYEEEDYDFDDDRDKERDKERRQKSKAKNKKREDVWREWNEEQ